MASEAHRCSSMLSVCSTMLDRRSAMALQTEVSTSASAGWLGCSAGIIAHAEVGNIAQAARQAASVCSSGFNITNIVAQAYLVPRRTEWPPSSASRAR